MTFISCWEFGNGISLVLLRIWLKAVWCFCGKTFEEWLSKVINANHPWERFRCLCLDLLLLTEGFPDPEFLLKPLEPSAALTVCNEHHNKIFANWNFQFIKVLSFQRISQNSNFSFIMKLINFTFFPKTITFPNYQEKLLLASRNRARIFLHKTLFFKVSVKLT